MLKLVIFDYDGLLVETEKLAYLAEKGILIKYGKALTKKIFDKYIGYSVLDTLKGYITDYKLPVSVKDLYIQRAIIMTNLLKIDLKLMPGAIPLLDYFHKKGTDMVIASSGERNYIEFGLKKLNIIHFFKNITCVSEVKKGKPNPDLFIEALRKNKIKAHEAIVFEDSVSGVKAAKEANIFCIAVPQKGRNRHGDYKQAGLIIDNLEEAIVFFEKNSHFR